MDLSKEYLQLVETIKIERVNYSKSVTQLVKSRPWYFYLTKNGVFNFLQNGAPDKTDELFAAKAFSNILLKFNEVEIQSLIIMIFP